MSNPYQRPTFGSALFYLDPAAALDWLENAFGFERTMVIHDNDGNLVHSEMRFGDGYIMVGAEWADYTRSPESVSGRNTQSIHVHLDSDIDMHCAKALAAGAVLVRDLENQFYGDRTYSVRDPGGHVWSFGQTVRKVSKTEAEKTSGLKIEGWV